MEGSSMSVILVGNGESLLGSKMGEKIDSYDTVVRFDGLNIEGYEEDVGTKTDILVLDSYKFLRYMKGEFDDIRDGMHDLEEIIILPSEDMYCEMALSFKEFNNVKYKKQEYNLLREDLGYHNYCFCDKKGINYLSSEFYMVNELFRNNIKFDYLGFDFLKVDLNHFSIDNIYQTEELVNKYSFISNVSGFYTKPNQLFKTYYDETHWSFTNMNSISLELKIFKFLFNSKLLSSEVCL
jgi:hypothetical protein